jgi:hypothetical protein
MRLTCNRFNEWMDRIIENIEDLRMQFKGKKET